MDKFAALLSLMAFVLLLKHRSRVDGSTDTGKDDGFRGIGAIVDTGSRIGKEERVAMEMAVEDFLNTSNQSLCLLIRNSQGEPLQAALAAKDLIFKHQVQAILGPQTWEEVSLVAEIGNQSHIPIVSLADATPKWATKLWTFLVQASPNQLKQMEAIAAIIQSWKWYQVTIIYEDKDVSATAVLRHLFDALKEVGAEIGHYVALPPIDSSLSEHLERLKSGQCRVFVVHLSLPLAVQLFEKAKRMKMMERDYVWITTDPFTSLVPSFNASTISSMQGIVGVKSYYPENESHFQHFDHRFHQRFSSEHPEEDNHEPSIFAVQAYDAAWTVALAMREKKQESHQILSNILQSDFHGLSGKVQFTNHQRLAPGHTFQIINVMGKSYRELGFWSDGLGFSETIGEAARNSSSMKDLGQVFWPGGPWYTPKGWSPPTNANPLRIGVPARPTFKNYVNVEVEQDHLGNNISFSYKGLAIHLFEATLQELPFHLPYKLIPFNGSYDALVEQIYLKNFDAAVGDIAIVAKRYKHAEFTEPYTESGMVMIVPVQSRTRDRAWLFIKPFTKAMWVLTAAITIYNGFVIWLIERNHCPELNGSIFNQIGTLIWLAFSTLFSFHGNKLNSNLSRITMVVWLFMALVITQTYTANLASMLTVPQLEPTVADVKALQNSNAMVGCSGLSFVWKYLQEVLQFHPNNIKNFSSADEYAQSFRSKEIAAIFLEVPLAKIFLTKYCKGFTTAGTTYKVGGFGFAFPRGSQLLPSVTQAMLKVSESGKLRDLENAMLASQKCIDMEPDDEPLRLSPNSFWVLFIFTGGTSSIALVVYIFRVYSSMSQHQVLWKLMMAVMKHWGNQKRRFSRRVSDIAESPPPRQSPNASHLQAADQV